MGDTKKSCTEFSTSLQIRPHAPEFVNNQVDVWFSEQIQLNLIYQTSFDQFQVCMSLCFCTGLEIRGFPW